MKVYVVNVNNCEEYPEDYWEGNRGVYSSHEKAIEAMTAQGFDASTRIRYHSKTIVTCGVSE